MIIGELTFRFSHLSPRFWCSGICRRMRVVGKRRCTAVPLGGLFGNCCSLLSIMGKWGVVIIPLDELSLASPQMVSMGSSGFTRRCLSAFHTIIFFPLSNVFYKSTKDWKLNTIIYIYIWNWSDWWWTTRKEMFEFMPDYELPLPRQRGKVIIRVTVGTDNLE